MYTANDLNVQQLEDRAFPGIPKEEWNRAMAHCLIEHTPEVKAAYVVWKAAQNAEI